ncbi:MAG: hypothetical protein KF680_07355 [Cryobacterium sp.]|nr:hypothetical protein [Cryobacterium sp.]
MTVVSSTHKRFRRAGAMLVAIGVLAFGLVPVSAAYAAPVSVTVTIETAGGDPVSGQFIVNEVGSPPGGVGAIANSAGELSYGLEPGDYFIYSPPGRPYEQTEFYFTVAEGGAQAFGPFVVNERPSVKGSVPDALGGMVEVNTYRWNGSYWSLVSPQPFTTDSNGDFQIWFSDPVGTWALQFVPSDTIPYLTTYLGGIGRLPWSLDDTDTFFVLAGPNTPVDVGQTVLLDAGVISGTVTGLGAGPIDDAYVVANDLNDIQIAETRTDASGAYTLKVPLDEAVTVSSYADGWLYQYFDGEYDFDNAASRVLTDLDPTWTDVDFELFPEVEAHFSVVADAGSGPEPLRVDSWLYRDAGSGFSPIPYDVDWDYDGADFYDLLPGVYRLGLRPVDELGWIPFSTVNTYPGTVPSAGDPCYFEFEVTGAIVEYEFELTADPASSACTEAPWVDGAGTPGDFSGSVSNIADVVGPATATLYVQDAWGDPHEVVSTTVDPSTGAYSLPGIYVDGDYFVGIETARDDPHISTAFGFNDQLPLYLIYDQYIEGIYVDAATDYDLGSVALPDARVLSGIVRLSGEPIEGVCVLLVDLWDDEIMCDQTDSTGRYYLKAPVPDDADPANEFRIVVGSYGFFPTYYGADPLVGDVVEVSEPGLDPASYDIDLIEIPSLITGLVSIWDPDASSWSSVDDGVAHLYRKSGTSWVLVESFPMPDDSGDSEFVFPSALADALTSGGPGDLVGLPSLQPGDYRIWFSQNGQWLSITEFESIRLSPIGLEGWDYGDDEVCYLDVPALTASTMVFYLYASVAETSTNCAPPLPPTPPTPPTPPGSSGTPPQGAPGTSGTSESDDAQDEVVEEEDTGGETPGALVPTNPSTPSPSPDPNADTGSDGDGPDLTWLWWTGGILLLLVIGGGVILVLRRP